MTEHVGCNGVGAGVENAVHRTPVQPAAFTADKEVGGGGIPFAQIFLYGIDDFVVQEYHALFIPFAQHTDLPGGQIDIRQQKSQSLTDPQAGIGKQRYNGKIPFPVPDQYVWRKASTCCLVTVHGLANCCCTFR